MVVNHTNHSGVDDGTNFYFPQSTFVSMGGSDKVPNGTSFEIIQNANTSSRCWEGNVTLFDTGDRSPEVQNPEVFGRRHKDYKAEQWIAKDTLQLKGCGSKCAESASGKFDSHVVTFFGNLKLWHDYVIIFSVSA